MKGLQMGKMKAIAIEMEEQKIQDPYPLLKRKARALGFLQEVLEDLKEEQKHIASSLEEVTKAIEDVSNLN